MDNFLNGEDPQVQEFKTLVDNYGISPEEQLQYLLGAVSLSGVIDKILNEVITPNSLKAVMNIIIDENESPKYEEE